MQSPGYTVSPTARHVALLLAISALTFFLNLGTPRLWDRDEPRNAGASLEMLNSNPPDWVVPRFNGELRVHKPVLINWFMMSSFAAFGRWDLEFAARFWSAALAAGTVLMAYAIGRRLFSASAAFWSGVVLASNLQFCMLGRAATPEMLFTFFLTASMLAYVLGTFRPKGRVGSDDDEPVPPQLRDSAAGYFPAWPVAALVYALMGVAVLAKGPAGLVLPTAVIGMFLLVMRLPERGGGEPSRASWWRRLPRAAGRAFAPAHFVGTAWSMRPITALVAAGVVALPWYVAVWYATTPRGAWVKGFLFEHNLGRAARAMEGHGGSLLVYPLMVLFYYPVAILVGLLPWSLLVVPAAMDGVDRVRRRHAWWAGYVFLACWAGVYVVAFSVVRTKLPSYMTPVYPALALGMGAFVHHWVSRRSAVPEKSLTDAFRLMAGVGVAAAVGVPVVILAVPSLAALRPEAWLGLLGLIPFAGALLALKTLAGGDALAAGRMFAATAVAMMVAVWAVAVVRVDRRVQHSRPILAAINSRSSAPRIATYNRLEPSWVFYAGQTLKDYRSASQAADFLSASPDAFIITSGDELASLRPALPPGVDVVAQTPYFGRKFPLYVIGRKEPPGPAPGPIATGSAGTSHRTR
jgi:4-amino-4-deoxy-L-arabinose transferase-like glycosyltransferase